MLRSAGARRLRKILRRCPAGAKIARRNASWTWGVIHERALSPADSDSFGGKTPAGSHSRPIGHPQLTWDRTSESALEGKGISKDLGEWIAIAKVRPKWR